MRKSLHKQAIYFFIVISILFSGFHAGQASHTLRSYHDWINTLSSQDYTVVQGNVFLMVNTDCPTFVEIFESCFGQNPASPYIIPQPPIEHSYVDPYYAVPLNTPGPDGLTNISRIFILMRTSEPAPVTGITSGRSPCS